MSAPVALIDANVLYDAVLRDLVMQLAVSGLLRPRWTRRINDEWTHNLLANRLDITPTQLDATKALMERAVPDGLVEDFESLIGVLQLPDPDDRHVLAAAIRTEADVIVTLNLKDFPQSVLEAHGIDARTPDELLGALTPKAWWPPRGSAAPGSPIPPCQPSNTSPSSPVMGCPKRQRS